MSSETPWTVGRLLSWTTDFLRQRGSDSPRLDTEVLLADALGCQRIELYTRHQETVSDDNRAVFRQLVRRRADGAPVAYLVGHREFYSLPFHITPDVLIPRPETEQLVLEVLERAQNRTAPLTLADVGTGSGIIAVCCAKYLPEAHVWATDVSQAALAVAAQNCQRHAVEARVQLRHGNLLAPIPAEVELQFVVSNPPYVSEAEYLELARDVRDYEPRGALVAGPRGTEVIAELVPAAAARLVPGGWLVFELSPMIAEAVRGIVEQSQKFAAPQLLRDPAGHARVLCAQRID